MLSPFQAVEAATKNINVSSSSQAVKIGTMAPGSRVNIRVWNDGSASVWHAFGDSTVTASASADKGCAAGSIEVLSATVPASGDLYVAAIAAASTGKIYFTPGAGI